MDRLPYRLIIDSGGCYRIKYQASTTCGRTEEPFGIINHEKCRNPQLWRMA
jgi:hypothetical protein